MAGRSVGSIEVTVDANTGRLKAKIVRDGEQVGNALKAAIERKINRLEGQIAKIDGQKEARLLRAQIEASLRGIKVDVDIKQAMVTLAAFEQRELDIRAVLDFDGANAQIFGFKTRTAADRAQFAVDANFDFAKIRADKAALEAIMADLGLDVDMDLATANAQMAAFRARQEADAINIDVDVDSAAAGEAAGGKFGDGFSSGLSGRMKLIAAAIVTLAEPAAVGLQGLLGPAIQVVSSAFSALAGAGGAASAIFAGVAATGVAAGIGLQGMGDAVSAIGDEFVAAAAEGRGFNRQAKEIQTAFSALVPNARNFAEALADVWPQFRRIQQTVASGVFEGLDDELRTLSTTAIPDIGRSLQVASISVNRFAKEMSGALQDINFEDLFRTLQPAVDSVGRGIANLTRAAATFFKAAGPAATELGNSFERATESLSAMIDAGRRSGALSRFLLEGVESLREWWQLTRNVGDALFTLFEAGKSGGDGLVRSLSQVVAKFDAWMESAEGQTALATFFDNAQRSLEALKPVLQGLGGFFDNLVTPGAITRFEQLGQSLGDALPFLGQLLELVGRTNVLTAFIELIATIGEAFQPVMPQIQALADAIGDSLMSAIAGATPIIEALAVGIGFIAEVITPIAPLLVGLALAFKVFGLSLTGLAAANPIILGLAAAATIAFAAVSFLGEEARKTNARTLELTNAIDDQVASLLDNATAANAAKTGLAALNATLTQTGEQGEKVTASLGALGFTTDDTVRVLTTLGREGTNYAQVGLRLIAKEAGVAEENIAILAEAVNNTDDNSFGELADEITAVAFASGMGREEAKALGQELAGTAVHMEQLQDAASETDLDKLAQNFIDISSAASPANQQIRDSAEALALSNDGIVTSLEVYNLYTEGLARAAAAADETGAATGELTAEQQALRDEIDGLINSSDAGAEGLTGLGNAADQAAARLQLMVGVAASMGLGVIDVSGLTAIATEADKANTAANNLKLALDILSGGAQGLEASTIGVQRNFLDLTDRLEEAKAGTEGFTGSLVSGTEAALGNREAFLTSAQGIQAWAIAAINSGMDADSAAAQYGVMRDQLIASAEGFDTGTMSATEYIDSILGAQGIDIETLISQPGMLQALIDTGALGEAAGSVTPIDLPVTAPGLGETAEGVGELETSTSNITKDVALLFGATGLEDAVTGTEDLASNQNLVKPTVVTTVSVPGLDDAIESVGTYGTEILGLPPTDTILFTQPGLLPGTTNVNTYGSDILGLPATDSLLFTQPGLVTGTANVRTYESGILGLPPTDTTSFLQPGLTPGIGQVNNLETAIDNVPSSKTVTFFIRSVGEIPRFAKGGIAPPVLGGIGGEAGLERAFFPDGSSSMLTSRTYVPPGTLVVPTEKLAQPTVAGGTVIQKQVNADVKVYDMSGDSNATATKVVNRMAASAAI